MAPSDQAHTDRRSGRDRRSGPERRSAVDRRTRDTAPPGEDRRRRPDRRGRGDRRSGGDRRQAGRLSLAFEEDEERRALLESARRARGYAHAPYSRVRIGAALATADGVIVTGCNVENATLGLTVCAERVALLKAISEGYRRFARIVVVADGETPAPCGACRQILWEFGGDIEVTLATLERETSRHRLSDLFPLASDRHLPR